MSLDSWNPKQYDKFKAERSQPYYDLLNLIEPMPNSRIIDLGCGTGELTSDLHRVMRASHTLGLDLSDQMLMESKKFERPGLQFVKGDLRIWREPKQYDIILSNAAIQWCDQHPNIFENLRDSLKSQGQLAIQMPMNHDYPTHVIAFQMSSEKPWRNLLQADLPDRSTVLNVEDYATLLFKLGFKQQKVSIKVYSHILESKESVVEWVKGTLLTSIKSRLSENDYQEFLIEYKQRLFSVLPDDRPFFYPFKRVLIWSRL